jgi:molecular chaperone GrpE
VDTQNPEAESGRQTSGDDLAPVYKCSKSSWPPPGSVPACRCRSQNVRRRAEQDVEKAHKFALEKFAGDLLPMIDSLELAWSCPARTTSIRPMREGIELTLKMFQDTLKRYNLEAIDPHGEPFNAEHHQAMAMQESAGRAEQRAERVPEGLPAQRPPAAPGHGGGQQGAGANFAFD